MNRYRRVNLNLEAMQGRSPLPVDGLFSGGIVLDRSSQDLEPQQSPDLNAVRLVKNALQQASGFSDLGSVATSRILALGEHRFVTHENEIAYAIFRLILGAGDRVRFEVWDTFSEDWILGAEDEDITFLSVLASWESFFESVYFADGEKVIRWIQAPILEDVSNDFPSNSILREEDDEVSAIISPAGAVLDEYKIHYSVLIEGAASEDGILELAILKDDTELGTASYNITATSDSTRKIELPHKTITIFEEIEDEEELTFKIKKLDRDPVNYSVDLEGNLSGVDPDPPPTIMSPSVKAGRPIGPFQFEFNLTGAPEEEITLGFFYRIGDTWTLAATENFSSGTNLLQNISYPGEAVEQFGISNMGQTDEGVWSLTSGKVSWSSGAYVEIKPFNKEDDDLEHGVTYKIATIPQNRIEVVEYDSHPLPGRYLGNFAGRLIVLQAQSDPAQIAWSALGNPHDFEALGSGFVILESRSDPVDALMAIAPLSSNIAALFRERSIMRVTQTGQVEPALAFYPWVEELGTESPFSVVQVPGGLMFLGHNRAVYQLTEEGPQEIGQAIQEELSEVIQDPSSVVGVYDPQEQHYILSSNNHTWTFDLRTGVWFRQENVFDLLSIVAGSDLIVVSGETTVQQLDRDSVEDNAYWVSPTLNQGDAQAEYSLIRLVLRYEAEDDTSLIVQASGDGGETWTPGFIEEVVLNKTSGDIRRAVQGFNVTGYDLRFRILFPSDAKVKLHRWRAELLQRGHFGRE